MSPDDPRHGTNPGYNAGCREFCCRRAHANYRKRLEWDNLRGLPRIVPAIGVRRRIEGLRALGWSGAAIMREAGLTEGNLNRVVAPDTMTRGLHDRLVSTFDRLVTRPVEGHPQAISSARNLARRKGWVTPDAWLNIDDPTERPDPGYREARSHTDLDPVVVDRILAGDTTLAASATKAERVAVVARWRADGRSLNELERLTGWEPRRYVKGRAA